MVHNRTRMGQLVSEEKLGGTDRTEVQTGVEMGGTEVGGSGTAGREVVSEKEVNGIDRTEVQTGVGMGELR